ncbi:MAG: type II toxin-antitoxin system Phd/YefM family antitoxin [Desulfobulbaceae bacterium]
MNLSSDIKPISFLKSHAADILKQINETRRPVIITQNGEPRAVLQDPESYDNMRKAIGLLKLISLGEEDIKQGNIKTQDSVFKDIEKMLAKKDK